MIENLINVLLFGGFAIYCFTKYLIITIKKNKYTKIEGKVIETKKSYIAAGDSISKGARNKYLFEQNGISFEIEDKFWGGNPRLKIGDKVFCYKSEKEKTKILAPEDLYYRNIYFISTLIFTIVLFL